MLTFDGILIISTPNAAISSPDGQVGNPFHKFELRLDEFEGYLKKYFRNIMFFGQAYPTNAKSQVKRNRYISLMRFLVMLDIFRLRRIFSKTSKKQLLTHLDIETPILSRKAYPSEFIFSARDVAQSKYFLAVCKG